MGPSGSGKSTLFNMIGRARQAERGGDHRRGGVAPQARLARALLLSLPPHRLRFPELQPHPVAYSAGERAASPHLPRHRRRRSAGARRRGPGVRRAQRSSRSTRPPSCRAGSSSGSAIARALANNPAILLADEPTANLDLVTGEKVIEIFKRLSTEHGVTIITATHDHKMLSVSDRIVWIKAGQVDKIRRTKDMAIKVGHDWSLKHHTSSASARSRGTRSPSRCPWGGR